MPIGADRAGSTVDFRSRDSGALSCCRASVCQGSHLRPVRRFSPGDTRTVVSVAGVVNADGNPMRSFHVNCSDGQRNVVRSTGVRRWFWEREPDGDPMVHSVADIDSELEVRRPHRSDIECLAELMLDAYLDTIDYDEESIVEARQEVDGWFDHPGARPDQSLVALRGGRCIGAILAGEQDGPAVFVSYVMVCADAKRRGLGSFVLAQLLEDVAASGSIVRAAITEGNIASERLFEAAGSFAGARSPADSEVPDSDEPDFRDGLRCAAPPRGRGTP